MVTVGSDGRVMMKRSRCLGLVYAARAVTSFGFGPQAAMASSEAERGTGRG
jgi:hypothetical protein